MAEVTGDIIGDDRVSPSEGGDRERCGESLLWSYASILMQNFISSLRNLTFSEINPRQYLRRILSFHLCDSTVMIL